MPKIKKVNMWRTGSRLPSGYQEVEYIKSTGTQYIDTGINYSNCPTPLVELRFKTTDFYDNAFIGFWNGSSKGWLFGCSLNKFKFTAQSTWPSDYIDADDGWHIFRNTSSSWNIDNGSSISTNATMGASGYNMWLFKANNYNPVSSNLYISYCKIYSSSGVLMRNFVPCYRTNDNVIGMYDLVYGTFYTNSGTGTFTKGDNVTIVEHQIWPVFKYSYDFRNKTVAQLQNDGWLNVSSATVSANGIYTSGWTSVENNVGGLQKALSTAKKLILKCDAISQGGVAGGFLLFDGSRENQTGMYANAGTSYRVNVANDALTTSSYSLTGNISTTYILDFENKILNYTFGSYKGTYSVTDAQLSRVRQCCTIYCPIDKSYMKDVSILIEQ